MAFFVAKTMHRPFPGPEGGTMDHCFVAALLRLEAVLIFFDSGYHPARPHQAPSAVWWWQAMETSGIH